MATKLNKAKCDKIAQEIADQEYAKLLKSGEKNELRTWFLTSSQVTGVLAKKFRTNCVAFFYNDCNTATRYVVNRKDRNHQIVKCLFDGTANAPVFK